MYMYNNKYKSVTQADIRDQNMYMWINHCVYTFLSLSIHLSLSQIMFIHMHGNAVMYMDSKEQYVRQTHIKYMN